MEFEDDDMLLPLPEEPSSPIQRKLKRLKRPGARVLGETAVPTLESNPSASISDSPKPEDPPESRKVADRDGSIDAFSMMYGSEGLDKEIGFDDGLDPLFGDPVRSEGWETPGMEKEMEEEKNEVSEGFDVKMGEMFDGLGKEKSAKKRLSLEEGEESPKKKKKSGKMAGQDGKPQDSVRNKRRLEKERKAHLEQIHAESQRLLRETRDASFKPMPLVQKPISSVLEKIRNRKLEVLKKSSVFYQSDYFPDAACSMSEFAQKPDLACTENDGREQGQNAKVDNDDHAADAGSCDVSESPLAPSGIVSYNKTSDGDFKEAFQTPSSDTQQDVSNDSKLGLEENKLDNNADNSLESERIRPLLTSSSKLDSTDDSSDEEEDDKENINPHPYKPVNMDLYPKGGPVKAFLDDEAEEEDDSDHDLMRFQDNEEDDESDENEVLNDLIATGYEEMPIDHEKRNELHQKWLEQQDSAATDNFLQRLKCGQKQQEPTLDEEDDEEFDDDSVDEISDDLLPKHAVSKNSKRAKQMIAQMFTDGNDVYLPSDDEETEQNLIRRRLLEQTGEEPSLISPVEDENSREVFGLIKKLNIAPDTKRRGKLATSSFDKLVMGGNSNSSSKSSFLGRATSSSLPSSRKQGSTAVRSYIFARDDSNSRNGIPSSENVSDMDQKENQPIKNTWAKSSSQIKKPSSKTGTEANISSGSSLFEILQRSSMHFDKRLGNKNQSNGCVITEAEAAYQFSAFKLGKKVPKTEVRS